jgi:hypothetical protein
MIQMGLIRKTASLSTLGGVKYTSRREAQTKAALAQAKLAKAERKAVEHEDAQDRPAMAQPTVGLMVRKLISNRKARQEP